MATIPLASELGVTGMDYEIAFNHADARALGRAWSVVLQENYINATRAIVTTAMAYTLTQQRLALSCNCCSHDACGPEQSNRP